jgi:hypothetical protein
VAALTDARVGQAISNGEDIAAIAAAGGALYVDGRLPAPTRSVERTDP